MKTTILLLIIFLAITTLVSVWLFSPEYYVINYLHNGVFILESDQEAYIIVQRGTSVAKVNRLRAWTQTFLQAVPQPVRARKDLAVFHLGEEGLSKYISEDFGFGGSPFPYNGKLHWGRGVKDSQNWPAIWEFTGKSFVRLAKNDANEIRRSFPLESTLVRREGWRRNELEISTGESSIPIKLPSSSFILLLRAESKSTSETGHKLILKRVSGTPSEELLIRGDSAYHRIEKSEFERLIQRGSEK